MELCLTEVGLGRARSSQVSQPSLCYNPIVTSASDIRVCVTLWQYAQTSDVMTTEHWPLVTQGDDSWPGPAQDTGVPWPRGITSDHWPWCGDVTPDLSSPSDKLTGDEDDVNISCKRSCLFYKIVSKAQAATAILDMSTKCECGKQVSPSLDVCELWVFPPSACTLHQECQEHSWHPLISVLEGRNKTAKFSSCHNLSTQHMFCPQAPLNLFQNNFADRGTLLVMPTSSRGEINVISCGRVCCPHSGHYDTLCFSPVIPSCFKSCNGHLAMLKGGWEYTGSVTVTRRGAERWRKWWFMLTINSVEARTEPS